MKTVLVVFGTRPEAIKLAPVIGELTAQPSAFRPIVAVTGQHREMLDQVLSLYGITPDVDLQLMRHGQRPEDVLAEAVKGISAVVRSEKPDVVLVQGDTITTLAGALAGFYGGVAVGHVEAGLRSGDRTSPFPEEGNRRLTTQVTDYHFAPTGLARERLLAEDVAASDVYVTGNTVVDAVLQAASMPCEFGDARLRALASGEGRFLLMTAHRRESWGTAMEHICLGARDVLDAFPDLSLVFPVHRNPVVRTTVRAVLGEHPRALLVEPLEYLPFVKLMMTATLILSDSGGVQEEAPSLDTPVLVLREKTERPEALETGAIALAGTSREMIARMAIELLEDAELYARMAKAPNPFGDGRASKRIAAVLAGDR